MYFKSQMQLIKHLHKKTFGIKHMIRIVCIIIIKHIEWLENWHKIRGNYNAAPNIYRYRYVFMN